MQGLKPNRKEKPTMKQTIQFNQFHDAFQRMGRGDQFTYNGLKALFEYLESLENETGEETELDVIALCCDYSEYENLDAFQNDFSEDYESLDDIEQATTVIKIDSDSFIIQAF